MPLHASVVKIRRGENPLMDHIPRFSESQRLISAARRFHKAGHAMPGGGSFRRCHRRLCAAHKAGNGIPGPGSEMRYRPSDRRYHHRLLCGAVMPLRAFWEAPAMASPALWRALCGSGLCVGGDPTPRLGRQAATQIMPLDVLTDILPVLGTQSHNSTISLRTTRGRRNPFADAPPLWFLERSILPRRECRVGCR